MLGLFVVLFNLNTTPAYTSDNINNSEEIINSENQQNQLANMTNKFNETLNDLFVAGGQMIHTISACMQNSDPDDETTQFAQFVYGKENVTEYLFNFKEFFTRQALLSYLSDDNIEIKAENQDNVIKIINELCNEKLQYSENNETKLKILDNIEKQLSDYIKAIKESLDTTLKEKKGFVSTYENNKKCLKNFFQDKKDKLQKFKDAIDNCTRNMIYYRELLVSDDLYEIKEQMYSINKNVLKYLKILNQMLEKYDLYNDFNK